MTLVSLPCVQYEVLSPGKWIPSFPKPTGLIPSGRACEGGRKVCILSLLPPSPTTTIPYPQVLPGQEKRRETRSLPLSHT